MNRQTAAGELRVALVALQKWVLQNLVIPDSDLAAHKELWKLRTDCESAAMRAGIAIDCMSEATQAIGDRLRIPYTVGFTSVAGKLVSAKVLQVGGAWSDRIGALVKVCDSVVNDWHPQKYSAKQLGLLFARRDGVSRYASNTVTKKINDAVNAGDVLRLGARGPFQLRAGFREELEQ